MEAALAEYLSHAPVFVRRPDGEILYWTQGAQELYGFSLDEALGQISHQLFRTVFPLPPEVIETHLRRDGVWEGLLRHTRKDGVNIWVESRWKLRRRSDGEGSVVVESNTDVTQRETLTRELDHRVKNTLAVVQGLARLKLKGCDPEPVRAFEDQLAALAGAHTVLLQHHWTSAGLIEVLKGSLSQVGVQDRVSLQGEDTVLQPSSVVAYSLAFHELATNALKHGALSAPEGRVEVAWTFYGTGDEKVHLFWREFGGPSPDAPPEPGGGTRLLEKVVAAELGVPVTLRFDPAGLVCEFDGPTQKAPEFYAEDDAPVS